MAEAKHPWVEDYTEFEAVLVCRNKLPEHMVDADLRAFQTFGWDDATTPGNDRTFTHAATGVIIRYEGSLVAIEYGDDRLTDALDDLFRAVYGLGWRLADVYHPVETLDRLLSDMGRKIPGSLTDFDLRAANDLGTVSDSAEGAALVAQGRRLMGAGDADQFHEDVLREFTELEPAEQPALRQSSAVMPVSGPVFIEGLDAEDDAGHSFDLGESSGISTSRRVADAGVQSSFIPYDEDETPRVFHPPGSPEALAQERAQRQVAVEQPGRHAQLQESYEVVQQPHAASPPPVQSIPEPLAPMEPIATATKSVAAPAPKPLVAVRSAAPLVVAELPVEAKNIVKVGIGAFCFSRPGTELDPAVVEALAEEYGAAEIVHLRPGVAEAKVHWNILGEFTDEQPHLAEKVASVLSGVNKGNALVTSTMLELRMTNPKASLRDVLDRGYWEAELSLSEEFKKSTKPMLNTDGVRVFAQVIDSFSGFLLCKGGSAFFDTNESEESDLFTVREVMQSSTARIYVVHQDSLDGPSVVNIIDALERLAVCYESSKRHVAVVAANREVSAGAQKKAQIMHAASEKLAVTLRELQDMGLTLPMAA